MRESTMKWAGLAGVVWAVANVATGFSAGSPPAFDAPADDVRAYLVDHRGAFLLYTAVFALTMPLLFAFMGALATRVRGARDDLGGIAASTITGSVAAGIACVGMASALALPVVYETSVGDVADDGLIRLVFVGTFVASFLGYAALAVSLLAIGAAASRSGLPSWLSGAALVVGGLLLVLSAAGLASDAVGLAAGLGFLLFALWTVAAGGSMARSTAEAPAAAVTSLAA